MAVGQKKVILRRNSGELSWGYLPQSGFVADGAVQFLDIDGRVIPLPMIEIQMISYVKDFNLEDGLDPERIGRREFLGRPRGEGLWLKVAFMSGWTLEGVAHFDTGFLDGLVEDLGFTMTVPEARSNTQRVFVPRAAIEKLEVLGYIGAAPAKRKVMEAMVAQPGLFGE